MSIQYVIHIVYAVVVDEDSATVDDKPHPVEIVVAEEEHKFTLNEEALELILCDEEIKDKPVVVLSVAGAFRKGKSFLLDFFLRYLQSGVSHM